MKKIVRSLAAMSASIIALNCIISAVPADKEYIKDITVSAADDNNDDWLHAVGSRLYDMNGNEVWLTGANWFGMNCTENVPHGL